MTTEIATKDALEKELRSGSRNVLFLIAHSDSESIFLPGLHGGRLSMKELDQLKRDAAPSRVVVLLACKTGQVNGKTNSIAEIILKNKLAATVLASEGIYLREGFERHASRVPTSWCLGPSIFRPSSDRTVRDSGNGLEKEFDEQLRRSA
jgi:hypothetical protein